VGAYEPIRIFFDADALIAGSASQAGASFLLLQLCELGLIKGLTCNQVIEECQRNIRHKLPQAEGTFNKIVEHSLEVFADPNPQEIGKYMSMAHSKDVRILAAAIEAKASYLVTFNTGHFSPDPIFELIVSKPGELLQKIRLTLSQLGE
jgi:predicted nucleic acid-binding protein